MLHEYDTHNVTLYLKREIIMEKLFFTITRWLMLVGASIAFVFLIGGGIYTFNLYKISQDTQVSDSAYETKEPDVSFNSYKTIKDEQLKLEKQRKKKIEQYVLKVIANGSKGHGFSMGSMPQNMLKGEDAKIVSKYVSEQLTGEQPKSFASCSSCHGVDGDGNYGMSPSLLKLPIYNGLISKVAEKTVYAPSESQNVTTQYTDPLQQYSAKIASYINKYAILVGQDGVIVDKVYDYFKDISQQYDTETFSTLKQQLDDGFKSLLKYGKIFKESKKDVKEAILWDDFIIWFINDFNAQLDLENKKYNDSLSEIEQMKNQKQNKALAAQVELIQVLSALGIALIIFILLTMILVLFKIELNTRKSDKINEVIEE